MVHENYYGTSKKEVDRILALEKIPIFDVDIQGTKNLQNVISDAVYIFIVPPSLDILKQRLINRKTDSEEQIAIRLRNAFAELGEYHRYDYCVVNDAIDRAVGDIEAIIDAEKCRRDRVAPIIRTMLEDFNDHSA